MSATQVSLVGDHSVYATDDHCRFYKLTRKILMSKLTSPAQSNLGKAALQRPHRLQWDAQIHPKLPLFLGRSRPPSNIPIPRPTHSASQTASGSTQPFCHSTRCRQTDRQTDRRTDQHVSVTQAAYARLIESGAAKNGINW